MFKVGDKVRCISPNIVGPNVKQGAIYTITEIQTPEKWPPIVALEGVLGKYFASRFELIKETPTVTRKWKDKTKGGHEYIILNENGKGDYPLVGQIKDRQNNWLVRGWTLEGRSTHGGITDLIPEVDYDEFAANVFLVNPYAINTNEQVYNRARQWFIDHPEELK